MFMKDVVLTIDFKKEDCNNIPYHSISLTSF